MKKNIFPFSCILLCLSIFSCQKENIPNHELDGNYNGILITSRMNFKEGVLFYSSLDTIAISVKITDLSFERPEASNHCKGQVMWNNDKISFLSEDCSCWCDCHPAIDCIGDWILGIFDGEMNGDTLRSASFFANTKIYLPDTTEYRYENRRYYELIRD